MWSLGVINEMNREAAEKARAFDEAPLHLHSVEQIDRWDSGPIPYLGDSCEDWDEGFRRVDELWADHSGFGQDHEPALSKRLLMLRLRELVEQYGSIHVAIESLAQFQASIVVWADRE